MARHTPLPWKVEQPNPDKPIFIVVSEEYGAVVQRAIGIDAKFIVQACNSHYELLEACKEMVRVLDTYGSEKPEPEFSRMKQAIIKAEGL